MIAVKDGNTDTSHANLILFIIESPALRPDLQQFPSKGATGHNGIVVVPGKTLGIHDGLKLLFRKKCRQSLSYPSAVDIKPAADPVGTRSASGGFGSVDNYSLVALQNRQMDGHSGLLHQLSHRRFGDFAQVQVTNNASAQVK